MVHLNLSIALLLALITFVSGVETATDKRVSDSVSVFMSSQDALNLKKIILYTIFWCFFCCKIIFICKILRKFITRKFSQTTQIE